ncbi:transcription factor E [Acrasis kona]|uniref:Transcription factor E n=1 Tax=Acrasis kona TaxID=1008807 RepID=A0AAW2ZGP4_9EUKA
MGNYTAHDFIEQNGALSDDIVLHVLTYCNANTLMMCASLCANWSVLITVTTREKKLFFKNYGYVVNKRAEQSNMIWKDVVFSTWPHFSRMNGVKDWLRLYRRRVRVLPPHQNKEFLPYTRTRTEITVCPKMEFECPMVWEDLEDIGYQSKKYCKSCKKDVHSVFTVEQLNHYASMGECVAFQAKNGTRKMGCVLF